MDTTPVFALLTPFDHSGKIDYGALKAYLQFMEKIGAKKIIVNGSTAEFASLTMTERKEVLAFIKNVFNGWLLVNVSATALDDAIDLAMHAKDYADSLLCLPPYYFQTVPETGLLEWFGCLLEQTELPMYLYNFPAHTQQSLSASMVSTLAIRYHHLVGIKDSSGDINNALQYHQIKNNFQVFLGNDTAVVAVAQSAITGTVSGGGSGLVELITHIGQLVVTGDVTEAMRLQAALTQYVTFRKSICEQEVPATKSLLAYRLGGFPQATRYPLMEMTKEQIQKLTVYLKKNGKGLMA